MHPARLFVLCGLPGSGKTTRAIELEHRFGATRLSADDVLSAAGTDLWDELARTRIESVQRALAERLLRLGTNVVVEWGSWSRAERDELRAAARRAGALAHLEFLDAPLDVLWERVRSRAPRTGTRAITRQDLTTWSELIERPADEELAMFDPMPPVRAGGRPGSPGFPYGSWQPTPVGPPEP